MKMNKKMKSKVWGTILGAAKAGLVGSVSYFCARLGTGCTTINIPADDARPSSFNGITTFRVNQ